MVAIAAVAAFALGVLLASYATLNWWFAAFLLLLAALLFVLRYILKETLLATAALIFLAASFGVGRVLLAPSTLPEEFESLVGIETVVEGPVVSDPDIREETQRLTVEIKKDSATTRVLVVAPRFPEVRYGETVRAVGVLERPEPFITDTGRTFRFDKFLAKDGIFADMSFADVEVVKEREGVFTKLRGALSDFKFEGIHALSLALPEPQASLAAGLILGGKQGLGDTLLDDFVRTGLVHIVVLSGYNVMIVAEFILRIFGFLSRRSAAVAAALSIAAFVLAAGAGAASVRAGIMASIALYGRATGRTYDAFRALVVAGLVMILWNPLTLLFDPGFQLSFIATLGLILGAPLVEKKVVFVKSIFLREIISATVAAQVAVLPLLLYQSGLFSLVALPANLLVLPVVPFAMLASALAMLAGFFAPFVATVIGFPAFVLLSYIIGVVEIAARLPFAAVTFPAFSFFLVLLSYAVLVWLVRKAPRPQLQQNAFHTRST